MVHPVRLDLLVQLAVVDLADLLELEFLDRLDHLVHKGVLVQVDPVVPPVQVEQQEYLDQVDLLVLE